MTISRDSSDQYSKDSFIRLALHSGVLKFGSFQLKSGRQSPYFFNAGLFYEGKVLKQLGEFYANVIIREQEDVQHLFGPAYKGLPIATATAIALAERGLDTTVTFNRKEIKSHGEGGQLIGAPLSGNTVILDDVITAGTAFRESQTLISANGGLLTAVVIALDRCERGVNQESAIADIRSQGIGVYSIIDFHDLIQYLQNTGDLDKVNRMQAYYREYGVHE